MRRHPLSGPLPSAVARPAVRRLPTAMAIVAIAIATAIGVIVGPLADGARAAGREGPAYRPPVDAPVTDAFRPPATPYGPGNRGLDYATRPGTPVAAAAGGEVVFAGQVGGSLHVVVLHPDGIRTSYSFLDAISVRRGETVAQGDEVGRAGESFHFGARAGDAYIDPAVLLRQVEPRVRLVPDDLRHPLSEPAERNGLLRMLVGLGPRAGRAAATAAAWARDQAARAAGTAGDAVAGALGLAGDELRGWLAYAQTLSDPIGYRVVAAIVAWRAAQATCTPDNAAVPPTTGRRRLILVGGLGSASGHAAVLDVDTDRLGYAPGDVLQFSYRGGSTADHGYGPADTQIPIEASAARLRDLIDREVAAHPGVPVDLIAHSQGGLVVRAALGTSPPGGLGTVITIATPHQGADLATLAAMIDHTDLGHAVDEEGHRLLVGGIDPLSPSVREMAATSDFIRHLPAVPVGVRLLSIGERLDPVVPSPRTRVEGATNVIVHAPLSANPHGVVPGSDAAEREMARFLAGEAPTCETVADTVLDTIAGAAIAKGEDAVGAVATAAGHLAQGG